MGTVVPGMAHLDLRKSFMTRGVICCILDKPLFGKCTSPILAEWLCGKLAARWSPLCLDRLQSTGSVGVLRRAGRGALLDPLSHDDTEASCGDPPRGS